MKWHFSKLMADQVETEVTQRDQFNNDQVDISETIVREAVQNSLDAALDDQQKVEVRFRMLGPEDGLEASFMSSLIEDQFDHAKASGIDINAIDLNIPTALTIEDFGTKGLTGSVNTIDRENFSDFWRRHGKSHKTGKSRGRWGLGKLVYSCSSEIGLFFGATLRASEDTPLLMGQTVLNLREVDGSRFPPHAFFCDLENEDEDDAYNRIPVPIKDDSFVSEFINQFDLNRAIGSGLSVVIPYPDPQFSINRMVGVAIANYFYPIITEKLVLKFNQLEINGSNIRELAHVYAKEHFHEIDALFDFIEEASTLPEGELLRMRESWSDDTILDGDDFEPLVLDKIRQKFSNGELVALYLPITISYKDGQTAQSSFSVFIQKPEYLNKGLDLYVRGGLTLPGEAKFRERRALGAMVAEHEEICAFLGDAENAAHTQWTSNTEKLRKKYQSNQKLISMIKKSLVQLYDLLVEVTEEEDKDALNEFFWFDEPEKDDKPRKPKPKPLIPVIPKKPRRFNVNKIQGGVRIESAEGVEESQLPLEIQIKLAYEVSRGSALNKWSIHDFDIANSTEITMDFSEGCEAQVLTGQQLDLTVKKIPFQFEISGFDKNRDLKVRAV